MKKIFLLLLIPAMMLASCKGGGEGGTLYTITVNGDGNGTAQASVGDAETTEAAEGTAITLNAMPNKGFRFYKWSADNEDVIFADATANSTAFIMPAGNVVITAEFRANGTGGGAYSVTVTAGTGGTATATVDNRTVTEANEGDIVTLTATANDNTYAFDKWTTTIAGVTFGNANASSTTFTMPAGDVAINAEFISIGANFNVLDRITDPVFKAWCMSVMDSDYPSHDVALKPATHPKWDTDGNGILSIAEAGAVAAISTFDTGTGAPIGTASLAGIEYFTGLQVLVCPGNMLGALNLSQNKELQALSCPGNKLGSLDMSANTKLTYLDCGSNEISSLDLSKNSALKSLYCQQNKLTSLDLSNKPEFKTIYCFDNPLLASLDLSNCTKLGLVHCYNCKISSLKLSGCTADPMFTVYAHKNELSSLDLSGCNIMNLTCSDNLLTSLDVSQNPRLMFLACNGNRMSSLNFTYSQFADFVLYCGMQTSNGTTEQTLRLTLRDDQRTQWAKWSGKDYETVSQIPGLVISNRNVTLTN